MIHILIIEDDPSVQRVLNRTLRKEGYEVVVASNGSEGLRLAEEISPALVICDWMMPGISGLEVCRQLKANVQLSTTFFIMLTARKSLDDRVAGLDAGADDFISKPFEFDELKARVRAGLRVHHLMEGLRQLTHDLKEQKLILEAEFAEAAEYVTSMLPEPIDEPIKVQSRFLPSKQLGGDCFDYYWLDPDFLVVYLLDVSGHGLGSALLSVSVQNVLRNQALPGVNFYQPNIVLEVLNENFEMSRNSDRYFTMWYGVYNRENRQLVYASAGHPPAILLSKGEGGGVTINHLKSPGVAVGMFPEARYQVGRCRIPPASRLYIFSDGVYELEDIDQTEWDLNALAALLARNYRPDEPGNLDQMIEQIRQASDQPAFADDFSLIELWFR